MAQAIAAHAGWLALQRGEEVKVGFLLGSRKYESKVANFALGSVLQMLFTPSAASSASASSDESFCVPTLNLAARDCAASAGADCCATATGDLATSEFTMAPPAIPIAVRRLNDSFIEISQSEGTERAKANKRH